MEARNRGGTKRKRVIVTDKQCRYLQKNPFFWYGPVRLHRLAKSITP